MTKVLLEDLAFPEGPRWHEGRLWFSDMHSQCVVAVDPEGRTETICEVPGDPSGLGWLPDGTLLVVSMQDRRLLRLGAGGLEEFADLSELASCHLNDMVVDAAGNAYVGNFGYDLHDSEATPRNAELVCVSPDGKLRVVANDLAFPNGTVITPDGRTLIVAESMGGRLTAFDIRPDGSLDHRRDWAVLENVVPDGICLDAEGAIWVASPVSATVFRVHEGGQVSDRVAVSTQPFACMLGGRDRNTLFIATAEASQPAECRAKRSGRIEFTRVEVPGAGLP